MLGVKKMDSISWIHRIPASRRLLIGARIVEIDDVAASFGIRGSQSVGRIFLGDGALAMEWTPGEVTLCWIVCCEESTVF